MSAVQKLPDLNRTKTAVPTGLAAYLDVCSCRACRKFISHRYKRESDLTIMNEKITPSYLDYLVPATVTAHQWLTPVYSTLANLGFGTPVVGYDPVEKIGSVRNHLRIIQIDTHNWYHWLDDSMRLGFDVHLDGEDDSCLCGFRRAVDGNWYALSPFRPEKARIPIGHTHNITLRVILEAAVELFQTQLAEWTPKGRDMRPALVAAYRKQLGLPPM